MQLQPAQRSKSKMRLALQGPSGSGKTYSALQLAFGLTVNKNIAVIDTENGSSDLYAHLGDFHVLKLESPFTPEKFLQAIDVCESHGCDVIIIDSLSHAWEGSGGILEIHGTMTGNSFANWSKVIPRHNQLLQRIMSSSSHVIATMRSKQDYLIDQHNGRMTIQKVGLKPVQKDGIDYEFTLVFELDIKHLATVSKDRTGLFTSTDPFLIQKKTGLSILNWCNMQPVNSLHQPSKTYHHVTT